MLRGGKCFQMWDTSIGVCCRIVRAQPHQLRTTTWRMAVELYERTHQGLVRNRTVVLAHFVRIYGEYGYSPTGPFQETG
ncbi:hypothetical protein BX264_1945 [Streptomyces sp. 2333.5]|nr:hypothetical protein BX264_1945 [Streptomyces sp. 2333.5]SEC72572.1 hypothetical protein SAMN05428943_2088 [Streptomyces sp. 2314.4]SED51583.1 hypothetical protein SAMN05428942_1961 [Streptomyces sp. 2112.2]